MRQPRTRSRVARVLLIGILTPLLMVLTPQQVQAAVYGSTGTASVSLSSWRPGDEGACDVVAYYVGGVGLATSVKFKVTCEGGWNSELGEDGATSSVSFVGGGECSYGPVSVTYAGGGKASGLATQPGIGPIVGGCAAQEVCLDFKKVNNNGFDRYYETKCVGIDLGLLPSEDAPVGVCPKGKAAKPTIGPYEWPGGSGYNTYGRKITTPLTDNPVGSWSVVAVNKGGADKPYYSVDLTGETLGQDLAIEQLNQFNAPGPGINQVRLADYYGPETTRVKKGDLLGVQITWVGSGLPGVRDFTKLPQAHPDGVLGVTDPTRCAYYYGTRIADVANSEIDEPAAPISLDGGETPPAGGSSEDPNPPDPDPAEPTGGMCDFSFSNPASWATAGICALVDLFRKVLDAIVQLPAKIMDLLGDALSALFVPEAGSVQENVESLATTSQDAFSGWDTLLAGAIPGTGASAPAAAREMTTGVDGGDSGLMTAQASGGGCAGPSFELPQLMVDTGLPSTWNPISACDGKAAELANWSRNISMAFLALFALVKTIELLQAGFGVSTHIRIVGGADWSGAQRWK